MMPSTVVGTPTNQTVHLRLIRTDSWPDCTATLDMDGHPIGRIVFASTEAADAFQAFLYRLAVSR